MRKTSIRAAAGLAACALCARALLAADAAPALREFRIGDAWGRDTVEFRTSASLEDIVGTTNIVRGVLKADPAHLKETASARIEVDVRTLKTGVEMRDGAVGRALGGDKSPAAVFTLEKVTSASAESLEPNAPVDLTAEGTLELKGVKKPVTVSARVSYVPKGGPFSRMRPGNFVKLTASFDLKLADFGVERNGPVLPLQVSETAKVTVTVLASDASAEEAKTYRENAVKYLGKAIVE
jgi:polyisoprenoid-binding protein YceI